MKDKSLYANLNFHRYFYLSFILFSFLILNFTSVYATTYTDVTYSSIQCMKPNSYYIFNLSNYYTFNPAINNPIDDYPFNSCYYNYRIHTRARWDNYGGTTYIQTGDVNIDSGHQYYQLDMFLFGVATDGQVLTIQTFNNQTGTAILAANDLVVRKLTSGSWCYNTVYSDAYTIANINISSACPEPTYFNYGNGGGNQSSFTSNATFIYNFTNSSFAGNVAYLNILDKQPNKYWYLKSAGNGNQGESFSYSTYNPVNYSISSNWTMNTTAYYVASNNYQELQQLGIFDSTTGSYMSTDADKSIGLRLYSGANLNTLAYAYGRYGNNSVCISPANNITNGKYVNLILVGNKTKLFSCRLYVNGVLYAQNDSLSILPSVDITSYQYTGLRNEDYINGRYITVNWTQFTIDYNMTTTNNTHIVSFNNTIPNINILQNTSYNISINNYITSTNLSDQIYCNMSGLSPVNNLPYNAIAGQFSTNNDYFDIYNFGQYLYLYSYFRNYSSNFTIGCCNEYNSCASQVVLFNISSSQSFPPQKIGSLQFINLTATNYTQPLTSIFTNFDKIEVMIANTYNLTCNYNNWTTNVNYTYVGNVTIQLQCNKNLGSLVPSLVIYSNGNNNFNSSINVTAINSYGSVSDWFIGFNGNVSNPFQNYAICPYRSFSFPSLTLECSVCFYSTNGICDLDNYFISDSGNSTPCLFLFNALNESRNLMSWNNGTYVNCYTNQTCAGSSLVGCDPNNLTETIERYNLNCSGDFTSFSFIFCNFVDNAINILPDVNTLSFTTVLTIVIATLLILGILSFIGLSKTNVPNGLILWIVGIQSIIIFVYFIMAGYIGWGLTITTFLVLIGLGFIFNKISGGGQ